MYSPPAEIAAFIDRVATGGEALIPFDEIERVTMATFAAMRSAKEDLKISLT